MIENRRTFLKTGTVLVGGVLLSKYTEPNVPIIESKKHEWIEDKGDFYIVRVPDTKSFTNEILDKPTIFLLGIDSFVRNIDIKGYINVTYKGNCEMRQLTLNTSKMILPEKRSLVFVDGGGNTKTKGKLSFREIHGITHPENNSSGIYVKL